MTEQTAEYAARINDIPRGSRACPTSEPAHTPGPVGPAAAPLTPAEEGLRIIREYDQRLTRALGLLDEAEAKLWRERERNRDLTAGLQRLYDAGRNGPLGDIDKAQDLAERLLGLKPSAIGKGG